MIELATAVFAGATGAHLLDAPRSARFASFLRSFDADRFLDELGTHGVRWVARSDERFPARLRAIHRGPIIAVGVSLGGNTLLRWAGENGDAARGR